MSRNLLFKKVLRARWKYLLAYVLIDVALGAINDVLNNLQQLPNVTEVYQLSSLHDILVKVDANSIIIFKELISRTIQRLDYVQSTTNLIVMPNPV